MAAQQQYQAANAQVAQAEANKYQGALAQAEEALHPLLLKIPNPPSSDTPIGQDDAENVVQRTVGEPRKRCSIAASPSRTSNTRTAGSTASSSAIRSTSAFVSCQFGQPSK